MRNTWSNWRYVSQIGTSMWFTCSWILLGLQRTEIGKDVPESFTLISVRNATLKGCTEGVAKSGMYREGRRETGDSKKGPYSDQPTTNRGHWIDNVIVTSTSTCILLMVIAIFSIFESRTKQPHNSTSTETSRNFVGNEDVQLMQNIKSKI